LLILQYLVVDTQLMVGGRHKYSLSPEEYIFGALNLYLDIVNIFMFTLLLVDLGRNWCLGLNFYVCYTHWTIKKR